MSRSTPGERVPLLLLLMLAALGTGIHLTEYGSLIPMLRQNLHVGAGQVALLSTFLYLGIGLAYFPGGWLADRFGARRVVCFSLVGAGLASCLLPLFPALPWLLFCRGLVGLFCGAAIVAASQAASRLGAQAALGQGLFGGAMQAGSALGLLLPPHIAGGWRVSFVVWGLCDVGIGGLWLTTSRAAGPLTSRRRIGAAFRSGRLLRLGLIHQGTFGIGQTLAPFLALLFVGWGLALPQAALVGGLGLVAGMLFRPLGGFLLSRRIFGASTLLRLGTALLCTGLVLLAFSHLAGVAGIGIGVALSLCGLTLPYATVLREAARIGEEVGAGPGTAQGVVSVLSAPMSAFGPALFGRLIGPQAPGFSAAFAVLLVPALLSALCAWLAGPARSSAQARAPVDADPGATIRRALARRTSPAPMGQTPVIALLDDQDRLSQALLVAGSFPVLVPCTSPAFSGEPPPHPVDEAFALLLEERVFRRCFDQILWPLLLHLVSMRVQGLCLTTAATPARAAGSSVSWHQVVERYLVLCAWVLQMPCSASSGEWSARSAQVSLPTREAPRSASTANWIVWRKESGEGEIAHETRLAAFLSACAAYTPPEPGELVRLRETLSRWLRRCDQTFLHLFAPFVAQVPDVAARRATEAVSKDTGSEQVTTGTLAPLGMASAPLSEWVACNQWEEPR
jgi:cyanate permease